MAARILIIEDNEDQVELLSRLLNNAGYVVMTARTGPQGLGMARKHQPDLILTDLMLPQVNGYEICSLLKQDIQYQHIPIVVLSATKVEWQDAKIAKECGADAYLLKTIGPRALLAKVQELLGGHAAGS